MKYKSVFKHNNISKGINNAFIIYLKMSLLEEI